MAKGRRPPDLRNTLGSFVQSALEQVGVVRDVVERGAAAQRERYESVKLDRRRRDAMAELGEAVYRLAVQGRLGPVQDEPSLRSLLTEIDDLDQRIAVAAEADADAGFGARAGFPGPRRESVSSGAMPGRPAGRPVTGGEVRVWRPVPAFAADAASEAEAGEADRGEPPSRHEVRVWRPSLDDVADADDGDRPDAREPDAGGDDTLDPTSAIPATERDDAAASAPAVAPRPVRGPGPESQAAARPRTAAATAAGAPPSARAVVEAAVPAVSGISFGTDWDDEWREEYDDAGDDLEAYMHADDVPERRAAGPSDEPGAAPDTSPDSSAAAGDEAPRQRRRRHPRRG